MGDSRRWGWRFGPATVGVEVGPARLRALRLGHGRSAKTEAMEVEWGLHPPSESIDALRERFGSRNVVAVALDMSVLFVKRLDLPPLSVEERRRIVAMDPQRYFPVRDGSLVAGVRDDDLVVAARTALFDTWMEALGTLGSVERVEPAPVALTRYLAAHDVTEGVLVMADPDSGEATVARLEDGRIETFRKVAAASEDGAELASAVDPRADACVLCPWQEGLAVELGRHLERAAVAPVPASLGPPDSFAVAHGALLGLDEGSHLTLLSTSLAQRLAAGARRRAVSHLTALLVALGVLGWSLDHRRAATLHTLEERIAAAQVEARPVLELSNRAASMEEEVELLGREASSRSNPLEVLVALTRVLPPDAYLTRFAASGDEWELNGIARDAARLVPLLEGSDLFTDVRFQTATTRVVVRNESLENFSLAFRHVAPVE